MSDDLGAAPGGPRRPLPGWAVVVIGLLSVALVGLAVATVRMAEHGADERRSLSDRVTRLERDLKQAGLGKVDSRLVDVEACLQVLTQYTEELHWNPPSSKGAGQAAIPDQCVATLYGAPSEAPSRP